MSWTQKLYETYNNCQSMIGLKLMKTMFLCCQFVILLKKRKLKSSLMGKENSDGQELFQRMKQEQLFHAPRTLADEQVAKRHIHYVINYNMLRWITQAWRK